MLESHVMHSLGLEAFPITTQTYSRKQEWRVLNALAGLGATLYKFAFDLRLLQSPVIGEWAEPFADKQVGSSAMPFKRNPISAEKIDSLARYLAGMPRTAWDNAAHSLLERTLDDSANQRLLLPEAFLIADELLNTALRLIEGLRVDETATARNLAEYGIFAATEPAADCAGQGGRRPTGDARPTPRARPTGLVGHWTRTAKPAARVAVRRRSAARAPVRRRNPYTPPL